MANQAAGHDIPQGAECSCEIDLVELNELLVVRLQVEPALVVHPLADQLHWRLRVVLLLLGQVDVIDEHDTMLAVCRSEGREAVNLAHSLRQEAFQLVL